MKFATRSTAARWAWVAALAVAAGAASAQQVYRIVGSDGRVTFSDKPPADPAAKAAPAPVVPLPGGPAATAGGAGLPFELRQVATRFPVTLYTGPECAPCTSGRNYLSSRGVPFTEKTVSTADDIAALHRLTGGAPALPLVTVGAQQLKGFSEPEWSQFLTAAGYPQTSRLPSGYRQPAATPLVASQPVAPQAAAAAAPPEPPVPLPPVAPAEPAPANPAGIKF